MSRSGYQDDGPYEDIAYPRDGGTVYAQEMLLPKGKTCADCIYCFHCVPMYGVKPTNESCDFHPIRFCEAKP